MQISLFLPALLLFLYALYRLVKDDYVFIRKGISLEESFDIAFIILWSSLFAARLLFLLFHYTSQNIVLDFFSIKQGGFSLTGAVIGGTLAIYVIGKQKRLPIGRLSDFLSLSFLYSLPLVFLGNALFATKNEQLSVFLNAIVYFVLLLFFIQFLYPKIMNRTIREGTLAVLFLVLFSVIAMITSFLSLLKNVQNFISPENIALFLLFLFSIVLLIKKEKQSLTGRRTTFR